MKKNKFELEIERFLGTWKGLIDTLDILAPLQKMGVAMGFDVDFVVKHDFIFGLHADNDDDIDQIANEILRQHFIKNYKNFKLNQLTSEE